MALIKNEIPILEFDSEEKAVLMPGHGWDYKFTKKAVMLFMEPEIEEYVSKNKCEIIGKFESVTKTFYVYKTVHKGKEITFCQAPLGGAGAVQIMEQLIAGGAIEKALMKNGKTYRKCKTWTTDGFYRETKEMVLYRKEEGYSVVEMECASLAACAKMRGVIFGQLLFTADSLANMEEHAERNWGNEHFAYAMKLAFDAVLEV